MSSWREETMPPFPQCLLKLCQAEVCGILGSCGNLGLLNSLVSVLPSSVCLLGHAGRWELQWAAARVVNGSPDLESCGAAYHGSVQGSTGLYKGFPLEADFSCEKDGTLRKQPGIPAVCVLGEKFSEAQSGQVQGHWVTWDLTAAHQWLSRLGLTEEGV